MMSYQPKDTDISQYAAGLSGQGTPESSLSRISQNLSDLEKLAHNLNDRLDNLRSRLFGEHLAKAEAVDKQPELPQVENICRQVGAINAVLTEASGVLDELEKI